MSKKDRIEKRKDFHIRVDEESLKQVRFLAENLFDVPAAQNRVIEKALIYLWNFGKMERELWQKYKEQEKKDA